MFGPVYPVGPTGPVGPTEPTPFNVQIGIATEPVLQYHVPLSSRIIMQPTPKILAVVGGEPVHFARKAAPVSLPVAALAVSVRATEHVEEIGVKKVEPAIG
jgi:hypothetical protein